MKYYRLIVFVLCCCHCAVHSAPPRPNILWIVSEDNSARYMPMYGDVHCQTPNLSRLAENGIVFKKAYANAPVCAVARTTILTGVNSATLGAHNMRSRYPVPSKFKPYPAYFREAGYYCTNAFKTDYNIKMKDRAIWDECKPGAHFKNRPSKDTPFLAVFNIEITHESNLFTEKIEKNRKLNLIPERPENDPASLEMPGYLPPLAEIKSDMAVYYDCLKAMDKRVGEIISDLMKEPKDVVDNTVIFYYSDHGGVLARQKRNLNNDGTQVPLIVYIPEKLKYLNPFGRTGDITDRVVDFTDLAPTILNLAGIRLPEQMQGKPFLGRNIPQKDSDIFLTASRFDSFTYFNRAITDGKVRYIRNFFAFKTPMIFTKYPFGQAGWRAYKRAFDNMLLEPKYAYWWKPQGAHFLYDTETDLDETENLAHDESRKLLLEDMKRRLKKAMLEAFDLGIIPEFAYDEILRDYPTVYDYARTEECGYREAFEAAWTASEGDYGDEDKIRKMVSSDNPFVRYWGAVGLLNMGLRDVGGEVEKLAKDRKEYNRAMACLISAYNLGEREAAVKKLESLLDFNDGLQSRALRTFIIREMSLLGADDEKISALEKKNIDGVK